MFFTTDFTILLGESDGGQTGNNLEKFARDTEGIKRSML